MKQFALWSALIIAVATAASLAMVHFKPTSATWQQLVRPGPLSARHAYLSDRCTTCHEPAVGVTVANCTACHANAERLLGRQPTAFHASIEECAACHIEHQPTNLRPLVMDHVALAKVGARTLARASRSDADSAATLKSLETWLRIQRPEQLDANSTREALNCAGCHDRRDPHFKRFGSDCAQCHGLESWIIAGYQHPSSRSKECVQCHQPPPSHFMEHFSMVSQKFAGKEHARVDECFECHNTTSWNDIVNVGFYKHH
ncbi:MAG: class III cytochrome C family protein [Gammaproteobacteria bacterium]|nr:class III cytochrome C family protein [Gammaproteobacteria bacterium]